MKKEFLIAAAVAALAAAPALAQGLQSGKTIAPATLAYPGTLDRTDARKLIGHSVENLHGEKVGDIEAMHIGRSGKVDDVILGVGGFLGVGQRDVKVAWNSLKIVSTGPEQIDRIVTSATKDQLKNMVAYTFDKPEARRTVFDTPY